MLRRRMSGPNAQSGRVVANLRNGLRKVELREIKLCGFELFDPHAARRRAGGGLAIMVGRGATKIHELFA
jgi:hypothetical protein